MKRYGRQISSFMIAFLIASSSISLVSGSDLDDLNEKNWREHVNTFIDVGAEALPEPLSVLASYIVNSPEITLNSLQIWISEEMKKAENHRADYPDGSMMAKMYDERLDHLQALNAALSQAQHLEGVRFVTVDAMANSVKAGGSGGPSTIRDGTPLDTGIALKRGQKMIITQTDKDAKWSAGEGVERLGNADGLPNFGDYTLEGQSFLFGTLVGQIDDGDYFRIGSEYEDPFVKQDGNLKLMYWDANNYDNSGSLMFKIQVVEQP